MKRENDRTVVRCDFDGGLHMPKTCLACDAAVEDKKIEFSGKNKLGTSKIIINFPVCEACYQADQQFVNAKPITIVGVVAILLSIFSVFNRPENYPPVLFLVGGIIWIGIIVAYLYWINLRARRQNSEEVLARRAKLKNAVNLKKMIIPRHNTIGQITLAFTSSLFAKSFRKLNNGEILK
ncbi:MAG TPA: hypothetical protein DCK95_09655 [Anaerolineaceae bacterium]|nr:hypothetical protein [Anaerolineaceae bacterium]